MLLFSRTLLEKVSHTSFSWKTSPALIDSTMAGVPPSSLSSISSMYLCVSWVTWKCNHECFKYLWRLPNTLPYEQLANSQLVLAQKGKWKNAITFCIFSNKAKLLNRNNTTFLSFKEKSLNRNNFLRFSFKIHWIYFSYLSILQYLEPCGSKIFLKVQYLSK